MANGLNSVDVRIITLPRGKVEEILSAGSPVRSLGAIIDDLVDIANRGSEAVNLSDASKLEEMGLELIRHARETMAASY